MMTSDVEAAALEALRIAQQKYSETLEVLRLTRSRIGSGAAPSALAEIIAAEAKVRERRAEFGETARVLQEAANALIITKAALDTAEGTLAGLRARALDDAPREQLMETVAAAEAAVALGRERLEAAGRELARVRAERAAGDTRAPR